MNWRCAWGAFFIWWSGVISVAAAPPPPIEGVLIVMDLERFREDGVEPFAGVRFEGAPVAERGLRRAASKSLRRSLTVETLNAMTADLTLALDQAGYPVVDIAVPEQDVRGGVVQVVISIGALGEVRVEGAKHFSPKSLARLVSTEPGESIRVDKVKRDLVTINTNPYRQADVVFERGDAPGETDIILNVTDRRPFRVFANYANNGVSATGLSRFSAGAGYGDLWRRGHILDVQFAISDDGKRYWSAGGSYVVPLARGHTFSVSGDYIRTDIQANDVFGTRGSSRRFEAKYAAPLNSFNLRRGDTFLIDMTHEVSAALQYKKFNNTLEFGGFDVFESSPEVIQLAASYALALEDEFGAWRFSANGAYSPGELTIANSDAFFSTVREGASSEYVYATFGASRVLRLPYGLSLVGRARAQFADGPLVASEQFAIGGATTVRGYQEATRLGDQGYVASVELRSPLWRPRLGGPLGVGGEDQLQALAFFDAGDVWDRGGAAGRARSNMLSGAGVGFRYRYPPNLTVRGDFGFQLSNDPRRSAPGRGEFGHVSVTLSY